MPTTSSITDPISNRDAIGSVDSADSILILDATDSTVKKATVSQLPSGSGVSDGDKGDISVTSSGTVWTIDNDAVTYAKMQNVSAASKLLGRGDSGSGDVQEITLGTNLSMSGTTMNAAGGGSLTVQEGDVTVSSAATTLDFGSGFDLTESPAGEVNIALDLSEGSVGTLPIANGGTGQTTQTAAFDALAPTTTAGDLIYHNGTDNVRLAAGTRYFQGLKTGGTIAAPYWENEPVRIYKTSEQTVANNTLTNDTVLMLDTTIYGTGTYNLYLSAYLESVDAAADVQYGAGAASGTFSFYGTRQHSVVNATTNVFSTFASPTVGPVSLAATVTGLARVEIAARVVCTVAGVWYFKFSQVTTTPASPSKCLAGSYIEFMKVA